MYSKAIKNKNKGMAEHLKLEELMRTTAIEKK